ncbi:hypothetical protein ACFL7D_07330 [candidate division KSB1 bacterium]
MSWRFITGLTVVLLSICMIKGISSAQIPFTFQIEKEGVINTNTKSEPFNVRRYLSNNVNINSGSLKGASRNCIVITGQGKQLILEFREDSLFPLHEVDFDFEPITMGPRFPMSVIGDFNNNGIDEIIIGLSKKILKTEWEDNQFITVEYEFPYYTYDCITGDATNDGVDDVIIACLPEPIYDDPERARYETYRIVLLNLINDELEIIYDKKEDLDIGISTAIPPDFLVCAADLDNSGTNEIVISEAQSDMSTTGYRSFNWNKESRSFLAVKNFRIDEVIGFLFPFTNNGTTYINATEYLRNERGKSRQSILLIRDETKYKETIPFDKEAVYVYFSDTGLEGFLELSTTSTDGNLSIKYRYFVLVNR